MDERLVCLLLLVAMAWSTTACTEKRSATGGAPVGSLTEPQKTTQVPQKSRPRESAQERSVPSSALSAEVAPPFPPESVYKEITTRWGPMRLHDLGPAAPVTATPRGALFITRKDEMILAKYGGSGEFTVLERPQDEFAKYGRGPAVSATHAYWASETGRLMRGDLTTRQVEPIFPRARPATRTAVVTVQGRDLVAFVAQIGETPMAYLWASPGKAGAEALAISPDGSAATSVDIIVGEPHPRVVVLEGRTGMSPVHVRTARVTARRITLEPDEVVWIGPGSHELTEIHAIDTRHGSAVALLPTAKSFHDFGLAQLELSKSGGEAPDPGWQIFPNGLDPAPVATAHLCGKEYILFARPSEEHPRSPQELHLSVLNGPAPKSGDLIARSRAFNDVSLAPLSRGALAVWTADRRTWAMRLTCPS